MSMPTGADERKYEETCMLIECYANKLCNPVKGLSYAQLIEVLDRLTELRDQCKKLWMR